MAAVEALEHDTQLVAASVVAENGCLVDQVSQYRHRLPLEPQALPVLPHLVISQEHLEYQHVVIKVLILVLGHVKLDFELLFIVQ